jgi:hypothetical protein
MILRVEVSALRLKLARSSTQTVLKKQDFPTCWIDTYFQLRNYPFKGQSRASGRNMTSKTFSSTNKITDSRSYGGFEGYCRFQPGYGRTRFWMPRTLGSTSVCSLWFVTFHAITWNNVRRVHSTPYTVYIVRDVLRMPEACHVPYRKNEKR